MSKFKVGDGVVQVRYGYNTSPHDTGKKAIVTEVGCSYVGCEDGIRIKTIGNWRLISDVIRGEHAFELVEEGSMSKYDELRGRIEALDNGWDKEANEIIQEMNISKYILWIPLSNDGVIHIYDWERSDYFKESGIRVFPYASQCEKNRAFRQSLLWLLDHSTIKDDKQEKIAELQKQIDELQKQIKELR